MVSICLCCLYWPSIIASKPHPLKRCGFDVWPAQAVISMYIGRCGLIRNHCFFFYITYLSASHTSPNHTLAASRDQSSSTLGGSTAGTILGDLEMFLMGLQMSHVVPLFKQHQVEFGQLLSMTDSDLQLMGVAQVGARKKILNGVLDVHKREWVMPEKPLPYGRPIRLGDSARI